nr:MBOAT family protein [Oscillospiraceae bacterium]
MTFSSLTFLFVFFPVTFLLYAVIRNHTARNILLAAASLVFYAFGEPVAVMIMLISIVLNYVCGRV